MGEAKRRRDAGAPPRRSASWSAVIDGGYALVGLKDGCVRLDGLCPACDDVHWIWRGELVDVLGVLAELGASPKAIADAATLVAVAFAEDAPPPAGPGAVH